MGQTHRYVQRMAIVLALIVIAPVTRASDVVHKWKDLRFAPISEMSGIARSRGFDDVYWIHNDSGDSARLFAVNGDGVVIFPSFLRRNYYGTDTEEGKQPWPGLAVEVAANVDWEDIAVDEEMIYIAEMGNNGNARRDLGVYVIPEPNPRAVGRTRALKFVPVRYPEQNSFPAEQWHYDVEGMFVFQGKLYFLTKHRQPGKMSSWEAGTRLYRLDSMKTDEFNLVTRIDSHEKVSVVTGADLSPDGEHLAILCYTQLWVFERPVSGDAWLSTPSRMISLRLEQTKQAEAVTWQDDTTIIIGNEESELFRINLEDMPD